MKVKEIMTVNSLKYCSPETQLHNAVKTMKSGNCGALPVIDKNKKVVGMITDRDIALSLAKKLATSPSKLPVRKIMSSKVHSVNADDDINTALREMRTSKIGRIPVTDSQGKLLGVLSIHNLLSQSDNGTTNLGTLTDHGESIAKTIKALSDRYNEPKRKRSAAL
ncbi:MAG: CBS domain-containing protein [Bacteroidetes bacterium]|nr:CBS domain-containing protein [Bacteroidota bacterium]